MNVIIIGGGIGGLTTALALRREGIAVSVYERAQRLGEVGAGITLWPNAMRALLDLGPGDAIVRRGRRFDVTEIRNIKGRILSRTTPAAVEERLNAPALAIHRAELHAALVDALPAEILHLGADCSEIEQRGDEVEVRFSNGTSATGDLVIGADGINSRVRKILFPDISLRYSGYTGWRGIALDDAAETIETWGCGARFGIVPLVEGRVYWYGTHNRNPSVVMKPVRHDELLRIFGHWHEPIHRLIRNTPAEQILQNDIWDIAPFKTWSSGRIVLLGDAAHPTTPNLGQGAGMAIESAVVLARELSASHDVALAIREYEKKRMPRTAGITKESWRIGMIGQLENPTACAIRDFVLRAIPASVAERRIANLVTRAR